MVLNFESSEFRLENVEEITHPRKISSNENIDKTMKLDETTIDDEKENTCNGNNILEKPKSKTIQTSETSTEATDDSNDFNSNPPGVGDLLVVDPNTSRHEEENGNHNGSKTDDSTSVSSSSSNVLLVDFQPDELSDEDMTLRISDEEEISETVNNETGSYFASSPFPKPEEKNKEEKKSSSEDSKQLNPPQVNSDSENENTSVKSATDSNSDKNTSIANSDSSVEKSDDLENLISDLTEQSKSILKTETEKVTFTELREEVEEFIKYHDNDEMENSTENIKPSETTASKSNETVSETKTSNETKAEKKETESSEQKQNETNTEITESEQNVTESPKMETEQTNDVKSPKPETETESSTSVPEKKSDTNKNVSKETIPEEKNNMEIDKIEESNDNEKISEIIENESSEKELEENKKIENEISEKESEENRDTEKNTELVETEKPEMVSEEIEQEQISEIKPLETETPEPVSEKMEEDQEDKPAEVETESAKNQSEQTKESDSTSCQTTDESEQVEPEKPLKTEPETDNKTESAPTRDTLSDSEDSQNQNSNDKSEENDSTSESLLMEVDYSERDSDNKADSEDSIVIEDDIEMREDFDDKKDEKEEKDAFDLLKEKEEEEDKDIKIKSDIIKEEIKGENSNREDARTLKRSLDSSTEETQDPKKLKVNNVQKPEPYVRLDAFRDFMSKKTVNTLTRAELEEFCLQKIGEVVNQTSNLGQLNRKIAQQEIRYDALLAKYTALNKQIRDLEVVHTRVLQEVRQKVKENNIEVTPVKITRSVGLQVSLQLVVGRNRPLQQSLSTPIQTQTTPQSIQDKNSWAKRKVQQRNSLPIMSSAPDSATQTTSMPPPSRPPLRSPQQKGIKTILPKVVSPAKTYPPADKTKDVNNSMLETYLQNPTPSTSKSPPTRPSGADSAAKVIDLTDEDDTAKSTTTTTTSNSTIRVVSPQQLQTSNAVTSSTLPRLTYLVQGNTGQGQQVLLATSTAPTRPGQVRSTLMFKPVSSVPPGQRLNLVRPPTVPGVTVISPSGSTIRPGQPIRFAGPVQTTRPQVRAPAPLRHPAPLPGPPPMQASQPNWKAMPPKPTLKISRVGDGIVLSWRMQSNKDMSLYEDIASYQLYAYQETNSAPSTDMWRKVGDVKALALPMACTLTQFTDGNKYHFAVRAVDVKSRVGPFSQPEQIALP